MSTKTLKPNPISLRLNSEEHSHLSALSLSTGLPKSELIRRAYRFAGPKIESGEVDLIRIPPMKPPAAAAKKSRKEVSA